jgi:FOG: Ankyrin repeat
MKLSEAAEKDDLAKINRLLQQPIESIDKHGKTQLYKAARSGSAPAIKLLLSAGANVNAKDDDGDTPLHAAARSGLALAVDLLLEVGADVSAKTKLGYTPFHEAAKAGSAPAGLGAALFSKSRPQCQNPRWLDAASTPHPYPAWHLLCRALAHSRSRP